MNCFKFSSNRISFIAGKIIRIFFLLIYSDLLYYAFYPLACNEIKRERKCIERLRKYLLLLLLLLQMHHSKKRCPLHQLLLLTMTMHMEKDVIYIAETINFDNLCHVYYYSKISKNSNSDRSNYSLIRIKFQTQWIQRTRPIQELF